MKKTILIVVLILLLVVTVSHIPRTYEIERTLEATEFTMATPEINSPVKVTIEGIYKTRWLGEDVFEGKIILQNYDVTGEKLYQVVFDSDKGYGNLSYQKDNGIEFLGYIKMDRWVNEMIICVFEDTSDGGKMWSVDKGTVITYPKRSLDEIKPQLYQSTH